MPGLPRQTPLVGGDQRQGGGKRHLEARMHHGLGRQQQHQDGGGRDRAQRERLPVDHDRAEHDRRHVVRALGRDLGARQEQIERRRRERREGRPFLDRTAHGETRDDRQHRPHQEEHRAGHHRHVVARDRQHVREARNVHGVVERRRNGVALAGDQRGRDRAGIARHRRANAPIDAVAHAFDERRVDEPQAGTARRRRDLDLPHRKAGGADALEIKIAREVVSARTQWRERGVEARLQLDEGADRGRLPFAHRDPHAVGRVVEPAGLEPLDLHDDPIGALALLADFYPSRNGNVAGGVVEDRMGDPRALDGCRRKAGASRGHADQHRERDRSRPRQRRRKHEGERQRRCGHRDRLMLGGEIEEDAAREGDRKPRNKPARSGLLGEPKPQMRERSCAGPRTPREPRECRTIDGTARRPRRRLPACSTPTTHDDRPPTRRRRSAALGCFPPAEIAAATHEPARGQPS
jgi:hypothetical protein